LVICNKSMLNKKKPDIQLLIKEKVLIIDGAMGTNIMNYNLNIDDYHGYKNCIEYLVISRPDIIKSIHSSFFEVGCDIVETNTFGANKITLNEHNLEHLTYEINLKAAKLAKSLASDFSTNKKPRYVSGSIGPGSKLPSLLHIDFDTLEDSYFIQALGLIDGEVDLFQIETSQDMLQIKSAIHGVKRALKEKSKNIPIIVQFTFENNKMLLGTDIRTAISTFIPYDLFAIGVNCGTGPKDMYEPVRKFFKYSPFYISVLPNAGFPKLKNGNYIYDLSPEEFSHHLEIFVKDYGVRLIGGCCGTTSDHLKAVVDKVENLPVKKRKIDYKACATSLYTIQEFDIEPKPIIIGERTNSNGSKKFREALLNNDIDTMIEIAKEQQKEGAHLLDLCVAYAGRNEPNDMTTLVKIINKELYIPLELDSTNFEALEAGLKHYSGRAVINSINLEDGGKKAKKILDLAKDFGAALICLTIDENGMAKTIEEKLEVAKRIYKLALSRGIKPQDLFFDPLTFTLASGDKTLYNAGINTLEALRLIKKQIPDSYTILGVSNISYGIMPKARKVINSIFLFHAVKYGLDAAIFHAGKIIPLNLISEKETKLAEDLIFNKRSDSYDPLYSIIKLYTKKDKEQKPFKKPLSITIEEQLLTSIIEGRKKGIDKLLNLALRKYSALEIINNYLLNGMQQVGKLFKSGKMQLPFVLKSAEVMKTCVDHLSPHFDKENVKHKGSILLATVKGDVHDIGKNLVDIIVSNNGYDVFNIGINKTVEEIVSGIKENKPEYIGLSGLLVKSTLEMKDLLIRFNEYNIKIPVICGGAALTKDFVNFELKPVYKGKVYYADEAFDALRIMEGEKEEYKPVKNRVSNLKKNKIKKIGYKYPLPDSPFIGEKILRFETNKIIPYLNKKVLYKVRWQMKDLKSAEKLFNTLINKLIKENTFDLKAIYGYFKCQRKENNKLIVFHNNREILFEFPFKKFKKEEKIFSLAQYFKNNDDIVPFFIATSGNKLSIEEANQFKQDDYTNYILTHGLGVEITEALAQAVHEIIRRELHLANNQGKRVSPGYSMWPDLENQKKIFQLLNPQEIGVSLTENFQLVPEQTVTAMVVCHPEAEYF